MIALLRENHLLVAMVVIAVGSTVGRFRWRGVSLGSAAVLFVAMALSAWRHELATPEVLGSLGLVLFAYSIGLETGPGFFAAVRTNRRPFMVVALALLAACATAAVGGLVLDVPAAEVAGTFTGATTNTPAMAAAAERVADAGDVAVGYAIAYPAGVVLMLLAAHHALRRAESSAATDDALSTCTAVVAREDGPSVTELLTSLDRTVVVSRVRRGTETWVPTPTTVLEPEDEVVVVGPRSQVDEAVRTLGRPADRDLHLNGAMVRHGWFTVSTRRAIGRTVGDLDLVHRTGAVVTRVRRLDTELLATDDLVLQGGDRVFVAGSATAMPRVKDFFGDKEHSSADINAVGLTIGVSLALLVGSLPVPVPGLGSITLGSAAAALLVALVLGHLRRTGPLVWTPSRHVTGSMTQLGLLLFLAYAGGKAGGALVSALDSPLGWKMGLLGFAVTATAAAVLMLLARWGGAGDGVVLAGFVAGAQTQPAVLGMADDRTNHDARVGLGYAAAYPVAMILKIVLAQVLVVAL